MLALHGWLDNAASFDFLAPLLSEFFYIVAIDLPGHGQSAHRAPGCWYHFIDYLDELDGATKALGWSRCSLLAHSLGGAIASVYAAAMPERVERLLLIESLGPLTQEADNGLAQLRRGIGQRQNVAGKTLRVFESVDQAVAARLGANELSEPAARVLVERGLRPVEAGWTWSTDPRLTLATPVRHTEAQLRAILAGIQAPSLIVLAEPATSYLPRHLMQARSDAVANSRVVGLPGKHHLHMDQAGSVAAAILEFCK